MAIEKIRRLSQGRPPLFSPTVNRIMTQGVQGAGEYRSEDASVITDTSMDNTASFKYLLPEEGLKSTQQLNLDWSCFENHTFFNSAQVKVNVAFEKIQNEFPFDGTNKELELFYDNLTGYEKYVYDSYPKNRGYLIFSGTNDGEGSGGTYITVKDCAGAAYPYASTRLDGDYVISPETNSMTIEYWFYDPAKANDDQVIIDKHSGSMGFMITKDANVSTTAGTVSFRTTSGSMTDTYSVAYTKNKWNHFAWLWDRTPGNPRIVAYLNADYYGSGTLYNDYTTVSARDTMYVGSGSALGSFTPANTLSGAMDELRIWHVLRTEKEIEQYQKKNVTACDDLKLCFRFNEPSGSTSAFVVDSAGNSVHGKLSTAGVSLGVRQYSSASWMGTTPMDNELIGNNPILFAGHPDVLSVKSALLLSASAYDKANPNLITRLVPIHYLLEGQDLDALDEMEGPITSSLTYETDPRSTELGATQTMLLLLYTWAKFFDEQKLFIQAFADLPFVDYDQNNTVPDAFLQRLAKSRGIELPPIFTGATVPQFINGENIGVDQGFTTNNLQYVRNQIWRRILINFRDIISSKGTIHSVKSFIRAFGIEPDNNFRIREYGGPTKRNLTYVRENRNEIASILTFCSGGVVRSPYLSKTRTSTETGFPEPGGSTTNNALLTSGSWTYEAIYKFPKDKTYAASQSLARFQITGAINLTSSLLLNCVAVSSSTPAAKTVTLFAKPNVGNPGNTELILSLSGTDVDLFDGDPWYVSFGRRRNDEIELEPYLKSTVSSSYFLRVAKNNFGTILNQTATASYYNDNQINGTAANMFAALSASYNASGAYIVIGSEGISTTLSSFLNLSTVCAAARTGTFRGNISQIRFWSKYLTDDEWPEHVRNFRSMGVDTPLTNFNFVTSKTGSWERLRLDCTTDQQTTASTAAGLIDLYDFTQNNFHMSGTGFPVSTVVINPERYWYSFLSPHFDEAATSEKVRIRGFQNYSNVTSTPWAEVSPVYEITPSEEPTDDVRFAIDFSIADTLNQDIVSMFSTLDSLDDALGNPELLFCEDYPDLENLRQIYFTRLTDKINHKVYFEMFKWFDTNLGFFIDQIIPRKTKFMGINFVLENHMLERPKVQYHYTNSLKDSIIIREIDGDVYKL